MMVPEPDVEARNKPEAYAIDVSERKRKAEYDKRNPPIPDSDVYNYQDVYDVSFPFHIDTPSLVFIGRLFEEPISAYFTISNRAGKPFWFKIKSSSRDMFKIKTPVGKIEKKGKTVISVIFYPNIKPPKPFCEYLHIYALLDNDIDSNVRDAFSRTDRQRTLPRKRIYADFIWHPNIGITQAYEYGRLLEMIAAKDALNAKRKGYPETDYGNITHHHRQRVLNKLLQVDYEEKLYAFKSAPEQDAYYKKRHHLRNKSQVAAVVMDPDRTDHVLEMYKNVKQNEEEVQALFNGLKKEMVKKGYEDTNVTVKIVEENHEKQKGKKPHK